MAAHLTVAGTIYQTPRPNRLEVHDDVVVTVSDHGRIESVTDRNGYDGHVDVDLGPGCRLLPGLVDCHIHAPQWPQLGTGLDLPLDQWLLHRTFPLEARYDNTDFARSVWDDLVPSLLRHGTTTAVYYSSRHLEATTALAETCHRLGQRAFVGRTAMDHPDGTISGSRDRSPAAAIEDSARSIQEIRAIGSALVQPIVTPRFIPACTDETLAGLGELAASEGVIVQTHCSENDWEHRHVLDRHGMSDAASLDRFGLLADHTVLAHGGHLLDRDFERLRDRGSGVAHCPLSNIYFGDAVFPARRARDLGVRVGLGTDIAGGPSPSILTNAAQAVSSSRMLEDGVDPAVDPDRRGRGDARIDIVAAFHLATLGGAELLGLPVGLLEVGRPFDAIAVAVDGRDGVVAGARHWPEVDGDDHERVFEKLVRSAGADQITHTWVDGRQV